MDGAREWAGRVFLILGIGLLLICVAEMANTAWHFPAMGRVFTPSQALRLAGYYLGILLYTNSVRMLTGFALVAGGVLAVRLSDDWSGRQTATRGVGLAMGVVSIVYALVCLLLVLPFGRAPYSLKALVPPLWVSVPVLLVTGGALFWAGFLMAYRLGRGQERPELNWSRADAQASAGTGDESVKSYDMKHEGGMAD